MARYSITKTPNAFSKSAFMKRSVHCKPFTHSLLLTAFPHLWLALDLIIRNFIEYGCLELVPANWNTVRNIMASLANQEIPKLQYCEHLTESPLFLSSAYSASRIRFRIRISEMLIRGAYNYVFCSRIKSIRQCFGSANRCRNGPSSLVKNKDRNISSIIKSFSRSQGARIDNGRNEVNQK